jgi:hypothetical protein
MTGEDAEIPELLDKIRADQVCGRRTWNFYLELLNRLERKT